MGHIAPILTYVAAGSTASSIQSGSTITVYGILIEGTSAGQVTFLDKDGTTLFTMSVAANSSEDLGTAFRADNGLAVTTPSGVTATIFHSHAAG